MSTPAANDMSATAMDNISTSATENTTANPNIDKDFSTVLTTGLAVHICCMIISAYILLCLIVYGVKAERWNWKTDNGRLHIACVITVAITFPRSFGILFLYLAPTIGALDHCEFLMDFSYGFGNVAIMFIYIFLWIRQRTIYTNSYMRALTPKWLNYFSIAMLGYVVIAFSILIFTYTIPVAYMSRPRGCFVNTMIEISEWSQASGEVLLAVITIGQIIMFLLFVYPMVKVKLAQRGNGPHSGNDPVISTLMRTTIGTLFVVVSNIASVNIAMAYLSPYIYPMAAGEPLYDLSFIISYISLVVTFENYKQILTAFCSKIESVSDLERKRTMYTVAAVSKDHGKTMQTDNNQVL